MSLLSVEQEYVTCPVCDTSVPKAFIESHTESCLQRSERPPPGASQPVVKQRPAAQDGTAASGGRAAAAAAGAAAAAAGGPLCSTPARRLPPDEFRAMVSAGWDRALQSVPGALAATPPPPLNAFDVLSAARVAAEPMSAQLFLEHRPGGSCVAHWRLLTGACVQGVNSNAGCAPSCNHPGVCVTLSATPQGLQQLLEAPRRLACRLRGQPP
jgi:hypothetical protein